MDRNVLWPLKIGEKKLVPNINTLEMVTASKINRLLAIESRELQYLLYFLKNICALQKMFW